MHCLTFAPEGLTTAIRSGTTIFAAANWAGLPIASTCGGRGICGNCRVTLLGESVLACQTRVQRDCTVEIPRLTVAPQTAALASGRRVAVYPNVRKVPFRSEPARQPPERLTAVVCGDELIALEPGDASAEAFGLALDIGTTTVAAALVDLATGVIAANESALNGQVIYGADVISRISHATLQGGLADLHDSIIATINQVLDRALERSGVPRESVYEAVAVGNATMLHLLLGIDPSGIGVSPFLPAFSKPQTVRSADLGLRLHPEARLSTLPLLGAYVGADIVGGLLATEFMRHPDGKPRLFVDVGTNSEIVLHAGTQSVCAAAPAGPAFEGAHIRRGMRASPGAIEHVAIDGEVRLEIVGGLSRPLGICGSGLIDAVAELRQCGLLDRSGRLAPLEAVCGPLANRLVRSSGGAGFLLSAPEDEIVLMQADIRALQYAKAAIASATELLLSRAGIQAEDLNEVLLAGSFGSYLNPASARAVGLVPWISLDRIRAVGNAAAQGALIALVSRCERDAARQMPGYIDYVELSGHPQFNRIFSEHLAFPDTARQPS